jgi:hypothetical protein
LDKVNLGENPCSSKAMLVTVMPASDHPLSLRGLHGPIHLFPNLVTFAGKQAPDNTNAGV